MTAFVCNFHSKTIYQYCSRHQNFLDYFYSSMAVFEICRKRGWDFKLCFSSHRLSQFLLCNAPAQEPENLHIISQLSELILLVENSQDLQFFINANIVQPEKSVSNLSRPFFLQNFTFETEFLKYCQQIFAKLGLSTNNYDVLFLEKYQTFCQTMVVKERPVVVVCSETKTLEFAKQSNYIQWVDPENDELLCQLLQLYLFSNACKIVTLGDSSLLLSLATDFFGISCVKKGKEIQFKYGFDQKSIECTTLAKKNFQTIDGDIFIGKNQNFNDLFGDVVPNQEKNLKIKLQDNVFVSFPEVRAITYLIEID